MICDLCSHEFEADEGRSGCSKCGFVKGCEGVRCPNCLYEMVPQPKWVRRIVNFFGKSKESQRSRHAHPKSSGPEFFPLHRLPLNTRGEISHLDLKDENRLKKVMSIGALPGSEVTLLQKFPSYVFQIGLSQFSIDQEIASAIYVKPL